MDNISKAEYRLAQLLKLPTWLFSMSFGIGTLILVLYFLGYRDISYAIGLLFIIIAVFINTAIFTALVICSFIFKEYQTSILQQACILLINIPVAILYVFLVVSHISSSSPY